MASASIFFNRPAIVKHIANIISDGELHNSICSNLEQVQIDNFKESLSFLLAITKNLNSKTGSV